MTRHIISRPSIVGAVLAVAAVATMPLFVTLGEGSSGVALMALAFVRTHRASRKQAE